MLVFGSMLAQGAHAGDEQGAARFVDVAGDSGLAFEHVNGMVGQRWLAEVIGAGVGVLDFDGDGRLDVWLVQGGTLGGDEGSKARDQLFRNVGAVGEMRFENVTERSGVRADGYGMGIATGDIDNDGDLDVYLANFGDNALYENLGDGRFRDVTRAYGLDGVGEWSVGASFADYDRDGWVDLFVVNYVEFDIEGNKTCHDLAGRPSYCTPEVYPPTNDRLYRNDGAGKFVDVTATSLKGSPGNGLGVVSADLTGDGWIDFYVANDAMNNVVWINNRDGTFEDQALLLGLAVNGDGKAEASMGIDAEDFDSDCDADLFLTHLMAETNTLYVNEGGWFADHTARAGLAASSSPFTGFGAGWTDVDNDGDLDLVSVNGSVTEIDEQVEAGIEHPLAQTNQIWLNDGTGRYREVAGGPAFELSEVSRGAAFADLDNDGDADIVVTNNNGPARLYRNESSQGHWIGISLEDRVGSGLAEARLLDRQCGYRSGRTDGSYGSANDARIVFGLGDRIGARDVEVRWEPGGLPEVFSGLAPGRYHSLRRGDGRQAASRSDVGDL